MDLLSRFYCIAGGRYKLPGEWEFPVEDKYYGSRQYFDVRKALTKYDEFVKAVQESKPARYSDGGGVPKKKEAVQLPWGAASDKDTRHFEIDQHKFKYIGPIVLDDQGYLPDDIKKALVRVIFTPSTDRSDIGLFQWELPKTLGVVVVPHDELEDYSAKWSAKHLIISCDQDCVGAARHHILKLAQYWKLDSFWMIDDSCPTSEFFEKTWKPVARDKKKGFENVLESVEQLPTLERFSNAALIGLTSTYSVQYLREESPQYCTNERVPTACVYVWLPNVPDELNYDCQLKSKEDVIFAARLICAKKDVIVDRHIHFEDRRFTTGGCTGVQAKEDPEPSGLTPPMRELSLS